MTLTNRKIRELTALALETVSELEQTERAICRDQRRHLCASLHGTRARASDLGRRGFDAVDLAGGPTIAVDIVQRGVARSV